MPNSDKVSVTDVTKIPPLLFGVIRWKKSIGSPQGDPCSGFQIVVDERTPSQFQATGGGHYEKVPGTGTWRPVTDSAPCSVAPNDVDSHVIHFYVPDVHLNILDGLYRITPKLTGAWDSRNRLFLSFFGFLQIQPLSCYIILKPDAHIATVEFEVVRRSLFR
jgi:hypothetical protein